MDTYIFDDIFDFDALRMLAQSLSAALRIAISIKAPQGEHLTENAAPCPPYDLRSLGLTDVCIQITIDGIPAADIQAGPVRLTENALDEKMCRETARFLHVNEDEYLRQMRDIPVMSSVQFETIINALSLLAQQLSQLGQKNMYLKSVIGSLENQEATHQQERALLEKLAETDSLTGLYNHRKFDDVFAQYSAKWESPICLVSADANYLKLMNDVFGHDCGDLMLKNIAGIMKSLSKTDWLVARCGGDEFRVIMPDTALITAQDYCSHVARLCGEDRSLAFPLSVALGAAEWERGNESLQDCFARADREMYRNKEEIKREQHIPDLMMERLYSRRILNRDMVERTSQLAYDFALYLGLSETQAHRNRIAAYYQDIGMAKLPEYFVVRGQSRSPEEKKQIQAHVTYGYNIAKQFEMLYEAAGAILSSHENWDGNSYPRGLKGYQIPIESRILRIADNFTYWTIPTKSGTNHTVEEAKKRLTRFSGIMYDPYLVSRFIKFLEERDEKNISP